MISVVEILPGSWQATMLTPGEYLYDDSNHSYRPLAPPVSTSFGQPLTDQQMIDLAAHFPNETMKIVTPLSSTCTLTQSFSVDIKRWINTITIDGAIIYTAPAMGAIVHPVTQ